MGKVERKTLGMLVRAAAALLVMASFGVLWYSQGAAEDRALAAMSSSERLALYRRTRQNIQEVCGEHLMAGMAEFCREQAEFVLRFPECDASCRSLAERISLRATR